MGLREDDGGPDLWGDDYRALVDGFLADDPWELMALSAGADPVAFQVAEAPPTLRWVAADPEVDELCEPLPHLSLVAELISGAWSDLSPLVTVRSSVVQAVLDHLSSDLSREQGGLLFGRAFRDPDTGQHLVALLRSVPCPGVGNPVHFSFTHDTWVAIQPRVDELEAEGLQVVGWYHSHPGLSVFLSGTDLYTQRHFFPHDWSIALVVDPLARHRRFGFFHGPYGTRCSGVMMWTDSDGSGIEVPPGHRPPAPRGVVSQLLSLGRFLSPDDA